MVGNVTAVLDKVQHFSPISFLLKTALPGVCFNHPPFADALNLNAGLYCASTQLNLTTEIMESQSARDGMALRLSKYLFS